MIGGDQDLIAKARRELEQLFAAQDGTTGGTAWACGVLEAEGLSTTSVSLRTIRALRKHEPRLSRVAARYLADLATGRRSPENSEKGFNPHLE